MTAFEVASLLCDSEERKRQLVFPSGQLHWFVSVEDLCILELLYGRTKDLADLERLFALPELDVGYIRDWVAMLPGAEGKLATLADLERRSRSPS